MFNNIAYNETAFVTEHFLLQAEKEEFWNGWGSEHSFISFLSGKWPGDSAEESSPASGTDASVKLGNLVGS